MEWVKIRCDILDHRKIKLLRKRLGGNDLVLIWMLLIVEAGKCNRGGYLMVTDNHPYTPETLSLVLGYSLSKVKIALSAYGQLPQVIPRGLLAIFPYFGQQWKKS